MIFLRYQYGYPRPQGGFNSPLERAPKLVPPRHAVRFNAFTAAGEFEQRGSIEHNPIIDTNNY